MLVLLPGKSHGWRSWVGCSPWGRKELDTTERLHFHALEKEMATHSSVLAWKIPGTAEPGELPFMGSHRVGHNWSYLAVATDIYLMKVKSNIVKKKKRKIFWKKRRREPSYTVDRNVNWHNCYREQYGGSLKNQKLSYYMILQSHCWAYTRRKP